MSDTEIQDVTQAGFEMLCMWARNIALLPLEEWQTAFDQCDAIAPLLDPTLYRESLYSVKVKAIRELIEVALPLKRAVLKWQAEIRQAGDL